MPSIQKNNRAAALLAELRDDDRLSIERLALLVGVTAEELRACRDHVAVLPPVQQAKLGRAVAVRVPRLAKLARRLEEQATAAAHRATEVVASRGSLGIERCGRFDHTNRPEQFRARWLGQRLHDVHGGAHGQRRIRGPHEHEAPVAHAIRPQDPR